MPFITARVISVTRSTLPALANAGTDQSVLCASLVQLEGTVVGDDAANHTFEWEQTFGTPVTLINPTTLTPSFINPQVSDLEFTLYLDRNTPFEDSDIVIVSRAPQAQVTTIGGASGSLGISGFSQVGTPATFQTMIQGSAKVSGWGFTNPPTARYSPIFKASDLDRVRENPSGDYWLIRDIDLSEYTNWNPIGTSAKPFSGDFQGNGFTINNLSITSSNKDAGLFSNIGNGANIENLGITNASISGVSSSLYKGILAGVAGEATIRNSYTEGTVDSDGDLAGGFIGDTGTNASSTYENTYSDVTVTGGGADTGGWAGTFQAGPTYIENYGDTDKTASVVGTGIPGGTEVSGLTTAQLTAQANYTGWDFTTTWEIDEGVSPATVQRDRSFVRGGGFCDDQWMITWSDPTVSTSPSPPAYKFKGTIVEEATANGWGFPRFIPNNRQGALMTPDTTHRITTVWDAAQTGNITKLFQPPPITEIKVVNDEKFTSKNTSSRFGPYGNSAMGSIGGATGTTDNLVITISNPRKITMQQDELRSYGIGGAQGIVANSVVNRFEGELAPGQEDTIAGSYGGATGIDDNLVIIRVNGASIG